VARQPPLEGLVERALDLLDAAAGLAVREVAANLRAHRRIEAAAPELVELDSHLAAIHGPFYLR
jgi:hypothetical protein